MFETGRDGEMLSNTRPKGTKSATLSGLAKIIGHGRISISDVDPSICDIDSEQTDKR